MKEANLITEKKSMIVGEKGKTKEEAIRFLPLSEKKFKII